ncbi:MAG: Alanine-tRNA ligase 2, partial [Candidatus Woesebacteria bacterium GW2011_GWE2_31_6]
MITSNQIREKYLNFFEKKGSVIIPPAPLVLENDPTTLFTSSGMQPLVPYLMGEKHPMGKRLVDYQPSIRTVDIDEVGDNRHLTYFEMLGNWSLGDYFKKEQLSWIWEFLTKELELPKEKLYVSFFEGSLEVPEDTESFNIWKSLGLSDDHIFSYGVDKNWWSRSGTPNQMPEGEIGGPDSEIFFEFDSIKHDKKFGEKCHPNCDCGRFLEIGNSVFIQYRKKADGSLEELPQKNVDFGGGLERISAALNNNPDVFKTDIFNKTINKLEEITNSTYEKNIKNFRIIADHLRASEALTKNGVVPSNKQQGYILRRLIRKIATKLNNFELLTKNKVILEELVKFKSTLEKGLKEVEKIEKINGKLAFDLYQTYGFPIELTIELFEEKGQKVDMKEFKKEFEKHKEMSRSTSVGMFKG